MEWKVYGRCVAFKSCCAYDHCCCHNKPESAPWAKTELNVLCLNLVSGREQKSGDSTPSLAKPYLVAVGTNC